MRNISPNTVTKNPSRTVNDILQELMQNWAQQEVQAGRSGSNGEKSSWWGSIMTDNNFKSVRFGLRISEHNNRRSYWDWVLEHGGGFWSKNVSNLLFQRRLTDSKAATWRACEVVLSSRQLFSLDIYKSLLVSAEIYSPFAWLDSRFDYWTWTYRISLKSSLLICQSQIPRNLYRRGDV